MTDKAMSPLRRRMIEDMTIRKLAPKTQQGYIRTIKDLAAGCSQRGERSPRDPSPLRQPSLRALWGRAAPDVATTVTMPNWPALESGRSMTFHWHRRGRYIV